MSTTYLGLQIPANGSTNWGNAVNANMHTLDTAYGTLQTQLQQLETVTRQQGFFNIDPEENYILLSTLKVKTDEGNGFLITDESGNPAKNLLITGKMDEINSDIFIATKIYAEDTNASVSFYLNGCSLVSIGEGGNSKIYYEATVLFNNHKNEEEFYPIRLDFSNFGAPEGNKFTHTKTDLITLPNNRAFYNLAPKNGGDDNLDAGGISLYSSSLGDFYEGQLVIKYSEFGNIKFETAVNFSNGVYIPTKELNSSTITFTRTPIDSSIHKQYTTINPWFVGGVVWESSGVWDPTGNLSGWTVGQDGCLYTYIPWNKPIFEEGKKYGQNAQEQSIVFDFYILDDTQIEQPIKSPVIVDYSYKKVDNNSVPQLEVKVKHNPKINPNTLLMRASYYSEEAKNIIASGAKVLTFKGTTNATTIEEIAIQHPEATEGDVYVNTAYRKEFLCIGSKGSYFTWEIFGIDQNSEQISKLWYAIFGEEPPSDFNPQEKEMYYAFWDFVLPSVQKLTDNGDDESDDNYFNQVKSLWGEISNLQSCLSQSNYSAVRQLGTPFIIRNNDPNSPGLMEYPAIFDRGEIDEGSYQSIYQYCLSSTSVDEDYNKVMEGDLFIYEAEGIYKLLKVSNGDLVSIEQNSLETVFCGKVFEDFSEVMNLEDEDFQGALFEYGVIAKYENQIYYWREQSPIFPVTSYVICKNSYEYTDASGIHYPKDVLYCFDPYTSRFILIEGGGGGEVTNGEVSPSPNTLILRNSEGHAEVITPEIDWAQLGEDEAYKVMNAQRTQEYVNSFGSGLLSYMDEEISSIRNDVYQQWESHQEDISRVEGVAYDNLADIETLQEVVGTHEERIEVIEDRLCQLPSNWERVVGGEDSTEFGTRVTANGELDDYPDDAFGVDVKQVWGETRVVDNQLAHTTFSGIYSASQNLFDFDKAENKFLNQDTGNASSTTTSAHTSDFIPCAPNTTYIYTCGTKAYRQMIICSYDKNKVFISGGRGEAWDAEVAAQVTTASNAAYMRICVPKKGTLTENGTSTVVDIVDTMVTAFEKGTSYIEPKSDTFALAEPIELGAWDYIDIENQQIIRHTYVVDFSAPSYSYLGVNTTNLTAMISNTPAAVTGYLVSNHYGNGTQQGQVNILHNNGKTTFVISDTTHHVYDAEGNIDASATKTAYRAFFKEIGLQIAIKTVEPISVEPISCPTSYTAYKGGTETAIGGGPIRMKVGYFINAQLQEEFNVIEDKISTINTTIGAIDAALDAILDIQSTYLNKVKAITDLQQTYIDGGTLA